MSNHYIDVEIAKKIMGWVLIDQRYYTKNDSITSYGTWRTEEGSCLEWKPTNCIKQAWTALEIIKGFVGIDIFYDKDGWNCTLHVQVDEDQNTQEIHNSHDSISMAICLSLNEICGRGGFNDR